MNDRKEHERFQHPLHNRRKRRLGHNNRMCLIVFMLWDSFFWFLKHELDDFKEVVLLGVGVN